MADEHAAIAPEEIPHMENAADEMMQEIVDDAGGEQHEVEHDGETGPMSDGARPLNVTDALSYLDAVKTQFMERPDVYNNFLDIMKDFKSQEIDTPGVIERVSTLFRGHNDLIQGFNTFLPPGYRIECTSDALDTTTTITVTTPAGITTSSTENQPPPQHTHLPAEPSPTATSPPPLPPPPVVQLPLAPMQPEPPTASSGSPMPLGASAAISTLNGMGGNYNGQDRARQGPAGAHEFHHAIQYVNKIKTRFEDDPETYKLFLDILHSYRKEQNHDDVYYKVEFLFKDAPDLLAEFKNFLPMDGGGPSFVSDAFHDPGWNDVPDKKGPAPPKRKKKPVEKEILPAPQTTSSAPKTNVGRSKKSKHAHVKENVIPGSPSYHAPYSRPPSPIHPSHPHHNPSHIAPSAPQTHTASAGGSGSQDELAFFDRAKKALESREMYDEFLKLLNLFSREIIDARALIARAEVFLGDSELYAQFKDLMGWDANRDGDNEGPPGSIRNWTVQSTETEERFGKSYRRLPLAETKLACSGRDELCRSVLNDHWVSHPTWASEESGFVAHKKNSYEEALHKSEEERHEFQFYIDIITRTIALLQPIHDRIMEMNADERNAFRLPPDFGGSSKSIYHRAIKKVYGRDAQGLEVLQALQDCPAIAVPVVLPRLKQKNEEWRRAQRDWNKVWREVDARNFYKSLDHQGITFKANDKKFITNKSLVTEIETAKLELAERVARAKAKAKAYKRSATGDPPRDDDDLGFSPHLEFTFEDIGVLQDALKLVFSFLDRSSIQYSSHERRSVERMLRSFVPLLCALPAAEFDAAFGPPLEADHTDNEDAGHDDTAGSDEGEESHLGGSGSKSHSKSGGTSGRRSAGGSSGSHGYGNGGVPPNDLRKKLLKTAQEKAAKARSGSASASRAVSPVGSDDDIAKLVEASIPKRKKEGRTKEVSEAQRLESEEWVKLMPVAFDVGKETGESKGDGMDVDSEDPLERLAKDGMVDQKPFYTNTTFYALLRLLQLLYSRLRYCKETAQKFLAREEKKSLFKVNSVAEELGLVDAHGPGAVLALAASVPPHSHPSIDGQSVPPEGMSVSTRPEAHFYSYMLEACEKWFEGELDQATFEENMRFLFGTKAYIVFTLDKLIAALIKQVQTAVMDSKCQELSSLLVKTRAKAGAVSVRELIAYRREAEQYLGQDDHLYRVEWDGRNGANVMAIWLLGGSDASIDLRGLGTKSSNATRMAGRWRAYAESYVLSYPTELVDTGRVRRPFLQRTKGDPESEGDEPNGADGGEGASGPRRWVREGRLAVGIEPGSLKMRYVDGSAEEMITLGLADVIVGMSWVYKHYKYLLGRWVTPSANDESQDRWTMAKTQALSYPPSTSTAAHCTGHSASSSRRPSSSKTAAKVSNKAPSTAVLAALAVLASATPAAAAAPVKEPASLQTPNVPEFLCPALVVAPLPSTSTSATTATDREGRHGATVATTTTTGKTGTAFEPVLLYQQQYLARSSSCTAYRSNFLSPTPTHVRPPVDGQTKTVVVDHSISSNDDVLNNNSTSTDTSTHTTTTGPLASSSSRRRHPPSERSPLNFSPQSRGDTKKRRRRRSVRRDDNACSQLYTSSIIPDRFELGDDGRWHKLSVWSSCSACDCESNDVNDATDNDISPSGVTDNDASYEAEEYSSISATTSSTPSASSNPDSLSVVLPDGWERRSSVVYQVPLILVASLLLAAAVTGAVWFSFFWRRRKRTQKQLALEKDLEKRRRADGNESEESGDDDDDDDNEAGRSERRSRRQHQREAISERSRREEKTKARWARAAAQWKSHVRWIHRRKRGRGGIIEGLKTRDEAMASGLSLSLARTMTSTSSRAASVSGSGGTDRRRSLDDGSRLRSSASVESVPVPGAEEISPDEEPLSGLRVHRDGGALRNAGDTSEGRRSLLGQVQSERLGLGSNRRRDGVRDADGEVEREVDASSSSGSGMTMEMLRLRGAAPSGDSPISESVSAAAALAPISEHGWTRREYDRPPPEMSPLEGGISIGVDVGGEEEEVQQGPPAYRSRRSVDVDTMGRRMSRVRPRVRSRRVRRRDEKRAEAAPGYVPSLEECAPYESSEEDGDGMEVESEGEGEGREERREMNELETMHVAVDDKSALARLAMYASAPPPSTSSPITTTPAPTPPWHLHAEPNAPPEPEWERFDEYGDEYPLADRDAEERGGDSPGAGPGPSTVFARSRSASPTPSNSRSRLRSRSRSPGIRSPTYSESHLHTRVSIPPPIPYSPSPSLSRPRSRSRYAFPAPPAPISSQLAYAPVDAGLVHPNSIFDTSSTSGLGLSSGRGVDVERRCLDDDFAFGLGLGFGLGELDFGLGAGPSAPPFCERDTGGGEGGGVEAGLACASAPPFFEEEGEEWGGVEGTPMPSAPPVDDDIDDSPPACVVDNNDREAGAGEGREGREREGPPPPLPEENEHVETADRNAVPSAVR